MPERVLNAAEELFFEGKVSEVSVKSISEKANLTEEKVNAMFPTLNDITKALSERNIQELKNKGEILAQQKGIEALKNLISNDIKFFYRVEVDRTQLTKQTMDGHVSALQNFDRYFNTEMPHIYATFFANNRDLLPTGDIDAKYYGHFISHSLKFFNFKTLVNYESTSEGRKTATEQIIGSLFGRDKLELLKF